MSSPRLNLAAMPTRATLVGVAGGLVVALIALMPVSAIGGGSGGKVCIRAWKEAPYRSLGYDHIVAVHNGCRQGVRCIVTTDVSPDGYAVTVAPKRTLRVLTFRGAPRRQFSARVQCRAAE